MGPKNGRRCDKKSIKKKMKSDFKKGARKNRQKKSASLGSGAIAHLYLPRTPSIFAIAHGFANSQRCTSASRHLSIN